MEGVKGSGCWKLCEKEKESDTRGGLSRGERGWKGGGWGEKLFCFQLRIEKSKYQN